MLRSLMTALVMFVLAGAGTLHAGEPTPMNCPPFGSARCPEQGPDCGGHPAHSIAYALRVGHADLDPISGLLYNPGTTGDDFKKWHYTIAPAENDHDAWCLEDCDVVRAETDPELRKAKCTARPRKTGPPAARPPHPPFIRCYRGDISGGIDYSKYPKCGAPVVATSTSTARVSSSSHDSGVRPHAAPSHGARPRPSTRPRPRPSHSHVSANDDVPASSTPTAHVPGHRH